MSSINIDVGNMIRKYRRANKYTQDELGEILQINQSYLGRIERGEVNITLDTLSKIANSLRVKPSELLEDKNNNIDQTKSRVCKIVCVNSQIY